MSFIAHWQSQVESYEHREQGPATPGHGALNAIAPGKQARFLKNP
jgi:hypothetical protein